ncbi:MAG: response regulator, partial [Candidatus Saccharimonadales bacterium]
IVVVEDEQTSRKALVMLLVTCGYQPRAFSSAEEALEQLRGTPLPHIALVDLDLPGMSGLDLISRLEKLDPSVFPILITGTDQNTLATRLHNRQVTYLRKPVNFEVLLTLLSDEQRRN